MKLTKKLLGIAVIFAVIGFMALPLTGCPDEGDDSGSGTTTTTTTETQKIVYYPDPEGDDIGDSIADFAEWLAKQELGVLCVVKLTLDNLGGNPSTAGSLGYVLNSNPYIKVKLDLSDSNFTSIGNQAFSYCPNLIGIIIPDCVISIESSTFFNCTSLTSVTIGSGVTSIGNNAFYGCTNLTGITIDENNLNYASVGGILYDKAKTQIILVPSKITGNITIPNSVTSIPSLAFYGCTSLTGVTIPSGVTSIGNRAFYGCTSLTGITVDGNNPNYASVDGILYNKAKTQIIQVPAGITGNVTIPNTVTSIEGSAFAGCNSLTGVTVVGYNPNYASEDGILYNRQKTQFIFIPRAKTEVTIPDTFTDIGGFFKNNTNIVSVTIGSGITSIGWYEFSNCTSLTSLTIGSKVTSIDPTAFSGCTSLASITIPNGVTSIGRQMFKDLSSLTSITIPNSVTSIGDRAFYGCTSLTSITIPNIKDFAFHA